MSRRRGPRNSDPIRVGNLDTDARAAYCPHEWRTFLNAGCHLDDPLLAQEREKLVASCTARPKAG